MNEEEYNSLSNPGLDDAGGVDLTTVSRKDLLPFDEELKALYYKGYTEGSHVGLGMMIDTIHLRKSLMKGLQ